MTAKKKDTKSGNPEKTVSLEYLLDKIQKMEEEMELLKRKVENNDSASINMNEVSFKGVDYDISWSWVKKIAYVLYHSESPMQLADIGQRLSEIDDLYNTVGDKINMLSAHAWRGAKHGRLKKFRISGNGGYYYCLK